MAEPSSSKKRKENRRRYTFGTELCVQLSVFCYLRYHSSKNISLGYLSSLINPRHKQIHSLCYGDGGGGGGWRWRGRWRGGGGGGKNRGSVSTRNQISRIKERSHFLRSSFVFIPHLAYGFSDQLITWYSKY